MKVGIVGAGWNGCHLALELSKAGHQVIIFERQKDIFLGVSGEFGVRLHKGPHYPRSKATRESCLSSFNTFCEIYPELVVPHESAFYAHGIVDALGNPSKVTAQAFFDVCHESSECQSVDLVSAGFEGLDSAFDLDEPSIALGARLRDSFKVKLANAGVEMYTDTTARSFSEVTGGQRIWLSEDRYRDVNLVINATGYQSLIPESFASDFPVDMEVVYQVCLALNYKDTEPAEMPFSFIVMDGWFPCLMPVVTNDNTHPSSYILTHGSYTILGSFQRLNDAEELLEKLDDDFVNSSVKTSSESEMCRFWPGFLPRFEYLGWKGTIMAKLKTQSEFRSSVVFEQQGVIYVFPGKVSNVVNAASEVLALIQNKLCTEINGFRYALNGVLDSARQEIEGRPTASEHNTCDLQTYSKFAQARKQVPAV